jgi:hypothetical protein
LGENTRLLGLQKPGSTTIASCQMQTGWQGYQNGLSKRIFRGGLFIIGSLWPKLFNFFVYLKIQQVWRTETWLESP